MEVAPETNILAEEDEYYDEVEVVYLGEARGRGVMTKRSFQRGEVLFTEESYCFVASVHCTPLNIYLLILIILIIIMQDDYVDSVCAGCGVVISTVSEAATAYSLTNEDSARFCSAACISVDYPSKLVEGRVREGIAALSIEGSQDALRLTARAAVQRSIEEEEEEEEGVLSRSSSSLTPARPCK